VRLAQTLSAQANSLVRLGQTAGRDDENRSRPKMEPDITDFPGSSSPTRQVNAIEAIKMTSSLICVKAFRKPGIKFPDAGEGLTNSSSLVTPTSEAQI
jgi:hypothetical protein